MDKTRGRRNPSADLNRSCRKRSHLPWIRRQRGPQKKRQQALQQNAGEVTVKNGDQDKGPEKGNRLENEIGKIGEGVTTEIGPGPKAKRREKQWGF